MLSGFALSVLSTVSDLLTFVRSSSSSSEQGCGVDELGEECNKLGRTVGRINAALSDAEKIEIRDSSFELWLKELRGVIYDAEDILDEYRYELLRCQIEANNTAVSTDKGKKVADPEFDQVVSNSLVPFTSRPLFLENVAFRNQIISRIKKIHILLDEISKDREAFRISNEDGERGRRKGTLNMLPTSYLINETGIFGRLNEKRNIINSLIYGGGCEGNVGGENIIILPIVGMGGLGKTTLAKMVYNDPVIQKKFDRMGWVYVSPEFDIAKITTEIIESITGQPHGKFVGLSAAQDELIKLLKNHNLFLVLDNVWDVKWGHWETLLGSLKYAERARIIMTTRNKSVACSMGTVAPHILGYLPEDDCWLLFQHYAFGGQESDEASSFVQVGRKIVIKCGRLPLAVKSIGILLSYEIDEDRWWDILESELWKVDENEEIFPALKLSYHLLPPRLKPCFLYCSLFPKGSRLFKDHVVYMWMAHGYVQTDGKKHREDVGTDCFNELHMRSFFEILDGGWFKIHDMIHDLARSITAGEFSSVVDDEALEIDEGIHHLYLENINKVVVYKKQRSLRTLFSTSFEPILSSFYAYQNTSRLRALDLKDANENMLASLFSNLKHLRYLGIGGDSVENLPESVGLLYNLETLIIKSCSRLRGLPITMRKLINLRCLYLSNSKIKELPELICQIGSLHTLHLEACDYIAYLPVGIGNLVNLHVFRLVSCNKISALPIDIGKLINLQILDLRFTPIKKFPGSIGSLYNLKLLDLEGCWEIQDPQNSFKGLINEKSLNIHLSIPIAFVAPEPTMQVREIKWHHPMLMCLASLGGKLSLGGDNPKVTIRQANKFKSFDLKSIVDIMSMDRSSHQLDALFEKKLYTQKYMCGMYTSSKNLLHNVQNYAKLVKLTIDGSYGIGYPEWSNPSLYEVTTVLLLEPYIENGSFLRLLGRLPNLNALILTGLFKTRRLAHGSFQCSHEWMIKNTKLLFPSLEFLELQDMPELEYGHELLDEDFPKLRSVIVKHCPKLRRIPRFRMLEELEIYNCGLSELEISHHNLQRLFLEDCFNLTSITELHNLNSLKSLRFIRCPNLQISPQERYVGLLTSVLIMYCPKLEEWCKKQQLNYVKVATSRTLRIPDVKHDVLNFSCLEHLCLENCVELSQEMLMMTKKWLPPTLISLQIISCTFSGHLYMHSGLSKLRMLEIRGCLNLESLMGLCHLRFLTNLVLCDCPLLQISSKPTRVLNKTIDPDFHKGVDVGLPPFLESVVVQGCHSLLSLNVSACEPSVFIEMEVVNCRNLMHIEGLGNLTCLETLTIVHCPHLLLNLLVRVPNCVVIAGCPKLKTWCRMHCIEPLDIAPNVDRRERGANTLPAIPAWEDLELCVCDRRVSSGTSIPDLIELLARLRSRGQKYYKWAEGSIREQIEQNEKTFNCIAEELYNCYLNSAQREDRKRLVPNPENWMNAVPDLTKLRGFWYLSYFKKHSRYLARIQKNKPKLLV